MKVIRISLKSVVKLENITLCLGYFDSLHLGHLTLIKKSMNLGRKVGVLTMDPNPSSFFNANVKEINSIEDKIEILKYRQVSTFELPKNTIIILTAKYINKKTINEELYSLVAHIKE